ncbi:tyrosine-type recombinase/integrase [Candidatus Magnetaquicoccus inordinatus]|uniref:tyrosine-type recombinase/integrase n=1 Tax=Candidatus Magnetaquicoccus inordinatus TaxID=2496818 RepID=UPI00187D1784|nr:tyrosine-type recombinase/integrase [Candidatus Magnetaquicoccus inordinatus]
MSADWSNNRMSLIVKGLNIRSDGGYEIAEIHTDPNHQEAESTQLLALINALDAKMKNKQIVVPDQETIEKRKLLKTIGEYVDEKMMKKEWTEKTKIETMGVFDVFIKIIGDLDVSAINKKIVDGYFEKLQKLPPNLNKNPVWKNKSIEDILKANPKPMEINTINKHASRLCSFFNWMKRLEYVKLNYFDGMQVKNNKKANEQRCVFTSDDLKKIFSSSIFAENVHLHPYYYWLPLIALYTGARIEEICQLDIKDIRMEGAVWVFDINDIADTDNNSATVNKKLKTTNSVRLVPIHEELIRFGLLKYVEQLKENGHRRLFPELKRGRDGYSQAASKWFARYLNTLGITDRLEVFHSFRHTFMNFLKQIFTDINIINELVGHEHGSIALDRYGKQYAASALCNAIHKLNFRDETANVKCFQIKA